MNCSRSNNNNSYEKKVKFGLKNFLNNKHFLNDAVLSVRITKKQKLHLWMRVFPKSA